MLTVCKGYYFTFIGAIWLANPFRPLTHQAAIAAFFWPDIKKAMKTIIYIDGFNFYYGLLKSGPYKWLNYHKLFTNAIIPTLKRQPTSLVIKLFSSHIKANFHPRGKLAAQAQSTYFRALKQHIGEDNIEII
jgi:hypothetical protein